MNGARMLGAGLLIAGVLALAFGGFSYTKSTSEANIGPISLEVNEKQAVNVPLWAGIAAAVVGAGLLISAGKKA